MGGSGRDARSSWAEASPSGPGLRRTIQRKSHSAAPAEIRITRAVKKSLPKPSFTPAIFWTLNRISSKLDIAGGGSPPFWNRRRMERSSSTEDTAAVRNTGIPWVTMLS